MASSVEFQCPVPCRFQPGGISGADHRVGSFKKDGISTGSVSTSGMCTDGQFRLAGSTCSGRGWQPDNAITINDAQVFVLILSSMVESPIVGLEGGDLGIERGLCSALGVDELTLHLLPSGLVLAAQMINPSAPEERQQQHAREPASDISPPAHHHRLVRQSLRSASLRLISPWTGRPPALIHMPNASQPPCQSPALKRRATVERAKAPVPIL